MGKVWHKTYQGFLSGDSACALRDRCFLFVVFFFLSVLPAWVGSLAYACGSLFGPVVGLLCDRFNHRTVGIAGGIISTMALLATSQAPNLTLMYFTFGVAFGFGNCCIFFVVLTIMPKYFIKRRSLATGLVLMGCGGGLIVMSPIIQALLTVSSWRITFIAMAGMLFVTCILSCSFDSKIGDNDKDSTDQDKKPNKLCPTLDFSYLRNKQFVIHLIGSITCFCGITVPLVHMVSWCETWSGSFTRPGERWWCKWRW